MAANPFVALQKQQRELIRQRDKLNKQIDKIDKLLEAALELQQEVGVEESAGDEPKGGTSGGGSGRSREGAKPAEVAAAAKRYLMEHGKPMNRGELLSLMRRDGMHIGGTNPANKVGTTLSRSSEFIPLKGHGYWLRNQPCAAANYAPAEEDWDVPGEVDPQEQQVH